MRHGYHVLEAANAGEALLLCEKHEGPIHLMLSDVVMPSMNGYDLALRLGQIHPEMKVMFMSGHTEPEILKRVTGLGRPILLKPFRPEILAHKVREALAA
jgi:CheY-like chemotaxis protein